MLRELRQACSQGELVPGEVAPSVRDLAHRYELSVGVVVQQMQVLVSEGLFHTIAGAGTFVGHKALQSPEFYLFVLAKARRENELKTGFEEEIAIHGGTTLVMTPEQIIESVGNSSLPDIKGVYLFRGIDNDPVRTVLTQHQNKVLPEVNFDDMRRDVHPADLVHFADAEGGRQATQHLIRKGHKEIAFLGVHAPNDNHDCSWSTHRLEGWHKELVSRGFGTRELAFLPAKVATRSQPDAAMRLREAATRLLMTSRATAVITANDDAALQLIASCRGLGVPSPRWPAIVSFDGTLPQQSSVLTSLRLPWEELGRQSALILWSRAQGHLTEERVQKSVALRIIPRLTCQANWSLIETLQSIS